MLLALRQGAATVFADAEEDYSSVPALKARLEAWRARYPAAFRDAYMTVSSPAVFSPFVRLELLGWDPIFGASTAGTITAVRQSLLHDCPQNCWPKLETLRLTWF